MKAVFNTIYKIFRTLIIFGIVASVTIFVSLYLVLSIPQVQSCLGDVAEEELSKLLQTDVKIENFTIGTFNRVILHDVEVPDKNGQILLKVKKLGAGFSWYNLVMRKRLVFTYAELIGLDGNIYKENTADATNLQFIIDALSPKDKNKPPTKFDLAIYNIVLRKSKVNYSVKSEPIQRGRFDKNHIQVEDLRADIEIPRLKNDDYDIKIKRLSFKENSGFDLKNLTVSTHVGEKKISVNDFRLELPNSYIALDDLNVSFNDIKNLKEELPNLYLTINTRDSYLSLSDLSSFVPVFSQLKSPVRMSIMAQGSLNDMVIPKLSLRTENKNASVNVVGTIKNLNKLDSLNMNLSRIYVNAKSNEIAFITSNFAKISPQIKNIISNSGNIIVDGILNGSIEKFRYQGEISTSVGNLFLDGDVKMSNKSRLGFNGHMKTRGLNVGELLGKPDLLGETSFNLDVVGENSKSGGVSALIKGEIPYFDFKGYRYQNITANLDIQKTEYSGTVFVDDENLSLALGGLALLNGEDSQLDISLDVDNFNLSNVNISKKYPEHEMSFRVLAMAHGNQMNNLNGKISVENFRYIDSISNGIELERIELMADNTKMPYEVAVKSNVINGKLEGYYKFNTIVPAFMQILKGVYPSLIENVKYDGVVNDRNNDFKYAFNIESGDETNSLLNFFKAPVNVLYPVSLTGYVAESNKSFALNVSAPFLAKKKKLIENTRLSLSVDSVQPAMSLKACTTMPNKKGKMTLNIDGQGVKDKLETNVSWNIENQRDYHGELDFKTIFGRVNETNSVMATIKVNPTTMVFNDTAWNVHESKIGIYKNAIRVEDFRATCDNQYVWIHGRSSDNEDEKLVVELEDVNLDYIFETLQINNVTFGGRARGVIHASNVLSKMPKLETERFYVEGLSYNKALLGNADMRSFWDNEKKFIGIQAHIKQPNGYASDVDGGIYPTKDSLSFEFNAKKLDVKFLQPFMAVFTSDISGFASGYIHLYGNFGAVNLYGDAFAENFKMKIDYTNVDYWVNDSIHIDPGLLKFEDIEVKDRNGHTAKLNGYLAHNDFKDLTFRFDVTDAQDFLCYDIPEKKLDDWYGTIYGTGSAFISGEPGVVNIDVNMQTATNSKFYFELSDEVVATEYNFITFTDKRKEQREAELLASQSPKDLVIRNFEQQNKKTDNTISSRVVINIKADINPLGQLILVMDPASGDMIKATGNGTITLLYDTNGDLDVRGKYTLDKGLYNFTLQEIIIKDFSIKEGSYISFDGDPLAAKIDISAAYALNANLQDLDESFASDKELNRTSVPVHALLNVSGSIAEPEITFDLEFPTLSSDTYRKVKSIISTDDMMNRQIIYLLALNRFYTPEYMGGTNKNNELASVASSTISSQLSSMLGQISDKWSIAPNFKTDKGDFSDVEVNLALSSQLLNNRLLLNGNFGYRDKMNSANNSNFIGDFDIEYLLNKAGNIRLKAYNHFNDQNYYVKNALTTQGVGVVFKFDFDNPFKSTKSKRRINETTDTITILKDKSINQPNSAN